MLTRCVLFGASLCFGCVQSAPKAPNPAKPAAKPPAVVEKKASPTRVTAKKPATTKKATAEGRSRSKKASGAKPRKKKKIAWGDSIAWAPWGEARDRSARENKPLCLVVYADWCPRCREMAPVFKRPKVLEASEKLVMVRQDNDARPEWLSAYADLGNYVPRIFFFGPDGQLRRDITSGHPRYPHFYNARDVSALLSSMRKATGG